MNYSQILQLQKIILNSKKDQFHKFNVKSIFFGIKLNRSIVYIFYFFFQLSWKSSLVLIFIILNNFEFFHFFNHHFLYLENPFFLYFLIFFCFF